MKLAASDIAWSSEHDDEMYRFLKDNGFTGLEIAPTRIFPQNPYDHLSEAKQWSRDLKNKYGLTVPSIQSIWYGQQGNIFNAEDRQNLIDYTKKAVDFAECIGAYNLVFGCPKARNVPDSMKEEEAEEIAVSFFKEIGNYAEKHDAVIALEANPVIYHTNFMNQTMDVVKMIQKVDSKGVLLNLDVGTDVYNYELDHGKNTQLSEDVKTAVKYVDHVHISEPGLKPIQKREYHRELLKLLENTHYEKFVSIEMGKTDFLTEIKNAVRYVKALTEVLNYRG